MPIARRECTKHCLPDQQFEQTIAINSEEDSAEVDMVACFAFGVLVEEIGGVVRRGGM